MVTMATESTGNYHNDTVDNENTNGDDNDDDCGNYNDINDDNHFGNLMVNK
jgi:hypothetical protein